MSGFETGFPKIISEVSGCETSTKYFGWNTTLLRESLLAVIACSAPAPPSMKSHTARGIFFLAISRECSTV